MRVTRIVVAMLAVVAMVLNADLVLGQAFPAKPIRIVTAEPGGGQDFAARLIAQGLTANLGQQVIVDNRGGAGGVIAAQTVAKAAPDGYTLLYYGSGVWLAPFLRDNVPYDPVKDFVPITVAVSSPNILVVHPSLPAKSVPDLIALAKARPGELNYAANNAGSGPHLAGELFKATAGVQMVAVPYKGGASALNDLFAGQVQLMFGSYSVVPHIKSGKVLALAVTSAQPSALFPGLPTVASSGLPGYRWETINIVFAPAGTSAALLHRLNQEIVAVLNQSDVKKRFLNTGVETVGNSPDEVAATIKSEMMIMGKVIKGAGIREQ